MATTQTTFEIKLSSIKRLEKCAAASGYSLSQLLNRAIDNFLHDEAPVWVHEAQRERRVSPAKPKAAKVAKASKSVPESRVTPEQLQAASDAFGKLMEHMGDWLAEDMYSFDAIGETTGRGFNPLRNSIDAQIKYLDEGLSA